MHVQVACLLCSIDPGTANLLLPIAQATIISTPILLRDQIRRGVRTVRDRRRSHDLDLDLDLGHDDLVATPAEPPVTESTDR